MKVYLLDIWKSFVEIIYDFVCGRLKGAIKKKIFLFCIVDQSQFITILPSSNPFVRISFIYTLCKLTNQKMRLEWFFALIFYNLLCVLQHDELKIFIV
jgi:hypothetical protein